MLYLVGFDVYHDMMVVEVCAWMGMEGGEVVKRAYSDNANWKRNGRLVE